MTVDDAQAVTMARDHGFDLNQRGRDRLSSMSRRPSDRLYAPRGFIANDEHTRIVQCTLLADGSLWLIAQRRITENKSERLNEFLFYEEDGNFLLAELWAVLYKLEAPRSGHPCAAFVTPKAATAGAPTDISPRYHRAVLAQKLVEDPLDSSLRCDLDNIRYGETTWSGNGSVMAVVTIINGFQEQLQVTVFDVARDHFVQRCQLDVETCKCCQVGSHLEIALNRGGDILSILNCEQDAGEGSWTVYDIAKGEDYEQLFSVVGCRSDLGCLADDAGDDMNFAFFTPDNDFCLGLSDGSRGEIESSDFPRFANRIIFFRYSGYDYDSDEEIDES